MSNSKQNTKKMSLFVATALVVGNMVGSGIFMLPNTLANSAGPAAVLISWLITAVGSILLALSFARLGSVITKTGGPYEYSKEAFGNFMGFINGWLYWMGSCIGNAAIIVAIISYANAIFPILGENPIIGFIVCSGLLWLITYLNIRGLVLAGNVGGIITVFKLGILLLFIIVAIFNFDVSNLTPMMPVGKGLETIPAATAITLWAFIGLESATVNGGEIENPEKNISKSTIYGILIASVFYILISFFAMGAMSQNELMTSTVPISDLLVKFLGEDILVLLNLSIILGIVGTGIGWILSSGNIAYAAAKDLVFPKIFTKTSKKYGTPHIALIVSSVITNIVLFMNFSKGFADALAIITLLATLSYLPIYAITSMADIVIMARNKSLTGKVLLKKSIVPILGFIYAIYTIYGSGAETVMYGFILMLSGIPMYVYLKVKYNKAQSNK